MRAAPAVRKVAPAGAFLLVLGGAALVTTGVLYLTVTPAECSAASAGQRRLLDDSFLANSSRSPNGSYPEPPLSGHSRQLACIYSECTALMVAQSTWDSILQELESTGDITINSFLAAFDVYLPLWNLDLIVRLAYGSEMAKSTNEV